MVVLRTWPPKSSTAIRAASREPSPLRSLYSPDMSVRTPIFTARSSACPSTAPKVVTASCASSQQATNQARETGFCSTIIKVRLYPCLCMAAREAVRRIHSTPVISEGDTHGYQRRARLAGDLPATKNAGRSQSRNRRLSATRVQFRRNCVITRRPEGSVYGRTADAQPGSDASLNAPIRTLGVELAGWWPARERLVATAGRHSPVANCQGKAADKRKSPRKVMVANRPPNIDQNGPSLNCALATVPWLASLRISVVVSALVKVSTIAAPGLTVTVCPALGQLRLSEVLTLTSDWLRVLFTRVTRARSALSGGDDFMTSSSKPMHGPGRGHRGSELRIATPISKAEGAIVICLRHAYISSEDSGTT